MSTAEIDALLTAAPALSPADGLHQWTYHTLFGLIAATGMRITEAMGLERDDADLDAGVLASSRKVVIAGPNAVRSMRALRENASEWIEVPRHDRPPSSANRGKRSATGMDRKGREWISSASIQQSWRASVEERKATWCVEGDNLTRCDVMSTSPSLAPVRARSLSGLCIDKSDHSVAAQPMAAAGRAIILPKQAIPRGLPTCGFCQNTSALHV